MKNLSVAQKSYLAGFLDGDGSIYVRLKPNTTYRFRYQVIAYVAFFQSSKFLAKFEQVCSLIPFGSHRIRKDGIVEYTIVRQAEIKKFLEMIAPFLLLKKEQALLTLEILKWKQNVKSDDDFKRLVKMIERFRDLNYSKKRKTRF